MNPKVGIVVPTLGKRPEYLRLCLKSIRAAGDARIHIVAPSSVDLTSIVAPELYDDIIVDPGAGLSAAIHKCLQSFPESVEYINWLGDDDMLTTGALDRALSILIGCANVSLVYGGCEYIDEKGTVIWKNRSGKYASPLINFGPQLIPQPGALFRRDAYIAIGGLNPAYKWAFDLDLLIRLKKIGKLQFVDSTLAQFRWHEGSLSVGGRQGSVDEASRIRRDSLPKSLKFFSSLWEIPMRRAILVAGERLNKKSRYPRE